MTEEKMCPLRARMMEDMRIRGMGDKAQKAYIRAIKDFTGLGRLLDKAFVLAAYRKGMQGLPTGLKERTEAVKDG